MRVYRLDADVPERWDDVHLNDAIIAQLLGSGHIPGPDLELPGWTEEVLGRLTLGANPYLPTRYVLSSLWVLNQNTQHGPTRSI